MFMVSSGLLTTSLLAMSAAICNSESNQLPRLQGMQGTERYSSLAPPRRACPESLTAQSAPSSASNTSFIADSGSRGSRDKLFKSLGVVLTKLGNGTPPEQRAHGDFKSSEDMQSDVAGASHHPVSEAAPPASLCSPRLDDPPRFAGLFDFQTFLVLCPALGRKLRDLQAHPAFPGNAGRQSQLRPDARG